MGKLKIGIVPLKGGNEHLSVMGKEKGIYIGEGLVSSLRGRHNKRKNSIEPSQGGKRPASQAQFHYFRGKNLRRKKRRRSIDISGSSTEY